MLTCAILTALLATSASATDCVPSDTVLCMRMNVYVERYEIEGYSGPSPDIHVRIGQTYVFDQVDLTNWYHPVGFAYFPDGAHGATWGGEERDEVEGAGELLYKIDGNRTTCPDAGDTGLDCYEPEFFYPRDTWMDKHYTAELTITQAMAERSTGGVIYYFCHIHSKMSARIIIHNADGSALSGVGTELELYGLPVRGPFDVMCGTSGSEGYADGGPLACDYKFFGGEHDTVFEQCLQAIDCKMNREMRVHGHDVHNDSIATFMQQMIPHHVNAINMAKLLLKHASPEVEQVEDLSSIIYNIMYVQQYQVHQFRNYLGAASLLLSGGDHCNSSLDQSVAIDAAGAHTGTATDVDGCAASNTTLCMKVNYFAGEAGYYEIAGHAGPSPDIYVRIGQTYVFDQVDHSNWYHPVGFAYFPDGAHGATWGGEERDEVEGAGELLYKIDGARTTCPDAGDTGLDCYEPEFFYPRDAWTDRHYTAELTITQDMADRSHGGVIYYFCHIHSKMSGRIIIQNADGSAAAGSGPELDLYRPYSPTGVDATCGTYQIADYVGNGPKACSERFLCGELDTTFEKCLQGINCKMNKDMMSQTSPDHPDKVAMFMQQMIPHHENAVNMAKILLKHHPDAVARVEDLEGIIYDIINGQNYQIHQFRAYLGGSNTNVTCGEIKSFFKNHRCCGNPLDACAEVKNYYKDHGCCGMPAKLVPVPPFMGR